MSTKDVYNKVNFFVKPRWVSIFTVNFIVYALNQITISIISSIYFGTSITVILNQVIYADVIDFFSLRSLFYVSIIIGLLANLVSSTVTAALTMCILETYRTDEEITLRKVWHLLLDHISSIAVISVVTSFISLFLALVPIVQLVSPILLPVINLALSFSYFLLVDGKAYDGLSALTQSLSVTRGHKGKLFVLNLRYYVLMYVGLFVALVGIGFSILGTYYSMFPVAWFGVLVALGGAGLQFFMSIKYAPYLIAAPAIYYANINEEMH